MKYDELLSILKSIKDEEVKARILRSLTERDDKGSWILKEAKNLGFRPKETREYVRWYWGLGYVGEIAGGVAFIIVGLFFLIILENLILGICFPLAGAISLINGTKLRRMVDKRKRDSYEKI